MANYRNNNTKLADKLRKIIKREMDKMGILLPELAERAGNVFALIRALGIRVKLYREKKC